MEQESGGDQETTEALVLRAAKTLQSSFAKQTGGEPRKWRDIPPDEKKMWLRLARAAERIFREPGSAPAVAAKPPASPPVAGAQEKVVAPAPKPAAPEPVAAKPAAPDPVALKPAASAPAPARDPIAAKPHAAAPAPTAKPATPQKAQGTSAMLRLLGLKPRDAA